MREGICSGYKGPKDITDPFEQFKKERQEAAQEDLEKYLHDYADIPCFKRGYTACINSSLVKQLEEALETITEHSYNEGLAMKFEAAEALEALRAVKDSK